MGRDTFSPIGSDPVVALTDQQHASTIATHMKTFAVNIWAANTHCVPT